MATKTPAGAGQGSLSLHTKYGNLPDVDISAPDLYESGKQGDAQRSSDPSRRKNKDADDDDTENSSDSANDSDDPASFARKHKGATTTATASKDIDSNSLSRTIAAAKFGHATELDGTRVDFSGKLQTLHGRKVGGGSTRPRDAGFETDMYLLDSKRQESAVDRLRHLKYEANLLEEELAGKQDAKQIESAQIASVPAQALVTQLQALQTRLSLLNSRVDVDLQDEPNDQNLISLMQQLSQPSAAAFADSQRYTGEEPSSSKNTDIALLDARLSELESLLGLQRSVPDEEEVHRPLLATLSRLEAQLSLLSQPRHLDTISRRVKVLVNEMDRVWDARKSGSSNVAESASSSGKVSLTSEDMVQLEHLFQVSNRLEPLLPIVPPVLNRLQTLSDLHASAAQFKTSLDGLLAKTEAQRQQTSELNHLLTSMEVNMEQNRTTMQMNLETLQTRISDVSKSFQSLQ